MKTKTILKLASTALAIMMMASPAAATSKTLIYSFKGGTDGAFPEFAMVRAPDGALYGVTSYGGGVDKGTLFKLTPPASAGGVWKETVLYRFKGGTSGASPQQLLRDGTGVFYGTTKYGGDATCNCGMLYQLSPPVAPKTTWTLRVLHRFVGGSDGAWPMGALIKGGTAVLVGTTAGGGSANKGTIYKITPAPAGKASRVEVIWSFEGGAKGEIPYNGVIRDGNGVLYGTTYFGGWDGGTGPHGTVFSLTPPTVHAREGETVIEAPWAHRVLHAFKDWDHGKDGAYPVGELVRNSTGTLFGATYGGGATTDRNGTVYKVTRAAGGTESVLYRFKTGSTEAVKPYAGLVAGPSGSYYGTAAGGGFHAGTIYKMTPGTPWTEKVVYRFKGAADGDSPLAALTPGGTGIYYGTTRFGGANSRGTVFKLVP